MPSLFFRSFRANGQHKKMFIFKSRRPSFRITIIVAARSRDHPAFRQAGVEPVSKNVYGVAMLIVPARRILSAGHNAA
jgi:hypothetical protein